MEYVAKKMDTIDAIQYLQDSLNVPNKLSPAALWRYKLEALEEMKSNLTSTKIKANDFEYAALQQQLEKASDFNEHQINFIANAIASAKIGNDIKVQILNKLLNFYL